MNLPQFEKARVLTIGDAMLDRYWHGDTRRVSAEAPVSIIDVGNIEDRPGGAANVALNVSSLGASAGLVAAVGVDEAAAVLKQKLTSSGIAAHFIEAPGKTTTTKVRLVSRNQQMLRADFDMPHEVSFATLADQLTLLDDYDNIVLSDYDKGVLADPASLIKAASKKGKPCLIDPKFKELAAYAGAEVLKPNQLELEQALGGWQSEAELMSKCQGVMATHGIKALLLTRASEGMTLITPGNEERHFPARTREVYDTSGAGDTVIAVLAAALASGATLNDAVALANIAAGIVVSHFGVTSVSGPELREEIDLAETANRGKMTAEQLALAVQAAKSRGEKVVFTNGCFDILHAGHVDYLTDAKAEGDRLIVAVNDDASVTRLKGEGRPINSLERRMTMLAGLAAVDWVVSFPEDTPEALIKYIQPNMLVKGGDYKLDEILGADIVRAGGGEVKVLRLVEDCSTTALVEKIRNL